MGVERPYVQPGSARAARTVSTSGTVRMECAVKIISGGQAGAERDRARGRARLIDSLVMVATPLDDQWSSGLAPRL